MNRKLWHANLLVTIGLVVSACAGAATPQAATQPSAATEPSAVTSSSPTATQAVAPTTGAAATSACLKVAFPIASGEIANLDTAWVNAAEAEAVLHQVYSQLLDLDNSFTPKPQLAESWETSADGKEWIFHLRKGVKFHDGRDFTAKDVVWTYQRILDKDLGSEALGNIGAFLTKDSITAVDDYAVKFTTEAPVPELPVFITTKNTYIIPNGAMSEDLTSNPVGTGPWIPVDYEPTQQPHRFVKNPNYFEPGLPKMDCLEMYVIQDPTARLAAIQSGEVDILHFVDLTNIPILDKDPNVDLTSTDAGTVMTLSMQVDTPPFDDVRIRQALKKVIDRQAMLDTVLLGYGAVGDDNPIAPSSPYAWRSQAPDRDVEGAKQLLAEAGYGSANPLKIDLYSADFLPGALLMAQLFKEQAAEAGVEVNLIVADAGEYWDNVWNVQPFFGSYWEARHPSEALTTGYRSTSTTNETHFFRTDFDALLDKAQSEIDPEKRADLYRDAAEMLSEEGGVIVPLFVSVTSAVRSNCQGFMPHVKIPRLDFRQVSCTK